MQPDSSITKPKPTSARRQRERAARRQSILDAAKAVFAKRGFQNATVEEIANQAELAVGTLYRYFQSKEELYVSMLFEAMELFRQNIEAARASATTPDEQLRTIWRFFYDFYVEQPESYLAFVFLHNEGLRNVISAEVLEKINQRTGENFRLVGEIVQAGVEAGIYRPVDSQSVVDVLWSLLMGLVQLTETRRNLGITEGNSLEGLHREALAWIEGGLLNSHRSESG
ncbi:MAG: TetR/AcrR family transcriptional regulator [Chloroflexi bacterium]|nr:TetR/AcrR family transcriptional regulator [Chloroflexota bacterium]